LAAYTLLTVEVRLDKVCGLAYSCMAWTCWNCGSFVVFLHIFWACISRSVSVVLVSHVRCALASAILNKRALERAVLNTTLERE